VDRVLVGVQVADEVLDAALVVELARLLLVAAQVGDRDPQAAREERGLPQALLERRVVEVQRLEDLGVRQEGGGRTGLVRGLAPLDLALRRAADVALAPQ